MSTRKKLKKLLGKELSYTGIIGNICDNRVCIEAVCHSGKEVTDHVWVGMVHSLKTHERGTRVKFKGKAYTYTDTKGERKHGLHYCKMFVVSNETYDEVVNVERKNLQQRKRS